MGYKFVATPKFSKQLSKLDKNLKIRILKYITEVEKLDDPRQRGEALSGNKSGYWRYKIGDYRVLCEFINHEFVILGLKIAHRSKVYKDK